MVLVECERHLGITVFSGSSFLTYLGKHNYSNRAELNYFWRPAGNMYHLVSDHERFESLKKLLLGNTTLSTTDITSTLVPRGICLGAVFEGFVFMSHFINLVEAPLQININRTKTKRGIYAGVSRTVNYRDHGYEWRYALR